MKRNENWTTNETKKEKKKQNQHQHQKNVHQTFSFGWVRWRRPDYIINRAIKSNDQRHCNRCSAIQTTNTFDTLHTIRFEFFWKRSYSASFAYSLKLYGSTTTKNIFKFDMRFNSNMFNFVLISLRIYAMYERPKWKMKANISCESNSA